MNFLRHPIILTAISVIMLCLPWLGGGGFWILAAFVPLLFVKDFAGRHFLWYVVLALLLWITVTCFWVSYATLIAAVAVPLVGIFFMLPPWVIFYFVSRKSKPVLAYITLICSVVVFEWWYALGDVSFPWLTLGGAFARDPWAVQWYSITGVYGGSAWILISNLLIYTAIKNRRVVLVAASWIAVPLAASAIMYFAYNPPQSSVQVAVLQPNIDPYTEKFVAEPLIQTALLLELAAKADSSTKYFIAPETAIVSGVDIPTADSSASVIMIRSFLRQNFPDALFIVGATTFHRDTVFNSALFIDSAQTHIYHKSKLVMGVEVVPNWLSGALGAVDLGGYVGSLGRQPNRAVYNGTGAAICYESIYGEYFAAWVLNGAQFMTIITNDGWWRDTPGYKQHFSYARLRAVECRRAIARSANTGISGFISPKGEVLKSLQWDERGIICASIPTSTAITFYAKAGDYIVRLAIYILGLSLLFAFAQSFRRRA